MRMVGRTRTNWKSWQGSGNRSRPSEFPGPHSASPRALAPMPDSSYRVTYGRTLFSTSFMLHGYTAITDGHLDVALYVCNEPVCYEPYFFSCLCLQTHKMSSVVIALQRLVDCGGGQFHPSHLADPRRSHQSSLAAYKHRKAEKSAGRVSPSLSRSPPSCLVCSTLVNGSVPSSIANFSTDATPSGSLSVRAWTTSPARRWTRTFSLARARLI